MKAAIFILQGLPSPVFRTYHSKIVFCCAANVAFRHNRNRKTSRYENENSLQGMQRDLAFLNIALWYPPNRHLCLCIPRGCARGALLWTMGEKVLCLRAAQPCQIDGRNYAVAVDVAGRLSVIFDRSEMRTEKQSSL